MPSALIPFSLLAPKALPGFQNLAGLNWGREKCGRVSTRYKSCNAANKIIPTGNVLQNRHIHQKPIVKRSRQYSAVTKRRTL